VDRTDTKKKKKKKTNKDALDLDDWKFFIFKSKQSARYLEVIYCYKKIFGSNGEKGWRRQHLGAVSTSWWYLLCFSLFFFFELKGAGDSNARACHTTRVLLFWGHFFLFWLVRPFWQDDTRKRDGYLSPHKNLLISGCQSFRNSGLCVRDLRPVGGIKNDRYWNAVGTQTKLYNIIIRSHFVLGCVCVSL
jgi:hypothetical protein